MERFCNKMCFSCEKCEKARQELIMEEQIEIDGPLWIRTEDEMAGLDSFGRP